MKKIKRRLMSILLAAVMVVSSVFTGDLGVVEVKAAITAPTEPQVHNFDKETGSTATDDDFFFFTGSKKSLKTNQGSIVYQGETLKKCLNMESSTVIEFTTSIAGELKMVFNSSGSGRVIKFTDESGVAVEKKSQLSQVPGDENAYILTIAINPETETTYKITKGDTSYVFYMVFTPIVPECETHTWGEWEKTVTPTCQTAGEQMHACTVCGATEQEEIAAGEEYHVFDEDFTTDVAATTTSVGSKSRHCTITGCDAKTDITEIPMLDESHEHIYSSEVTKNSTCIQKGETTYKCECGDTYTEPIELKEHTYSEEWTVDVEATTSSVGSESRHCTTEDCTATTDEREIPKIVVVPHIRNFEKSLESDSFFTFAGSKDGTSASIDYNGETLYVAYKVDASNFSVSFTTEVDCVITLVSGVKSSALENCGLNIKIGDQAEDYAYITNEGTNYGIITCKAEAGKTVTIKRSTTKTKEHRFYYISVICDHQYASEVTKTATCIEAGETTYTCSVCNDTYTEPVEMTEHSWSEEWTTDVEPGDYTAGSKSHHCTTDGCEAKNDITPIDPVLGACEHDYVDKVTKEATCLEAGELTYTCSKCGAFYTEVIEITDHNYSEEYTEDIAATVLEKGSESRHCMTEGCTATTDEREIPAIGVPNTKVHNFTESGMTSDFFTFVGVTDVSEDKSVSYGGVDYTKSLYIDGSGSVRVTFDTDRAGTLLLMTNLASDKKLKVNGTKYYTYDDSGIIEVPITAAGTIVIEKDNSAYVFWIEFVPEGCERVLHAHSYEGEETTAPTCVDKGVMTYTCSCGKSYTEDIEATGVHTYVEYVSDNNATCTEDGTKTAKCEYCEATDTVADEGSAKGHTWTGEETTAPTCVDKGVMTYTCSCGESYTEDIDATGEHTYVEYVSDNNATCTEDGTKTAKCEYCEATDKVADEGSAKGHTWTGEETTAPTCVDKGVMTYTCSCDESYTEDIEATGEHTYVEYVSDNNATCTEDGTKTAKCEYCEATDTVADEGSAKGHAWSEEWTIDKDATETEAGSKSRHCTVDGCDAKTDETVIEPTGCEHEYDISVTTEPTCAEKGVRTYDCTKCEFSYTEDIEATGEHTYGEFVSDNNATCTEDGTKTAKCDNCEATETVVDEGSAKGHIWSEEWTTDKEATETETGSKSHHCTVEGCDAKTDVTLIEPLGCEHNYESEVTTDATCVDAGVRTYTCSKCGYWYTEDIEATGEHTWSEEWTIDKEPSETETGSKSHHCTVEGCDAKTDITITPAIGSTTVSGDANGDSVLDISDAVMLKQFLAGMENTGIYEDSADLNKDGVLDIKDAVYLCKILAGYEFI